MVVVEKQREIVFKELSEEDQSVAAEEQGEHDLVGESEQSKEEHGQV